MESHRAIDPEQLGGAQLYDLLCASVVPRPIALVTTISSDGDFNIAPFSFYTVGGTNPPSLCFSVTLDMRGEEKQTLRNIRNTRQFTVHQVVRDMGTAMAATADAVNDLSRIGLTLLPGESVGTARVLDSPLAFECALHDVIEHGSGPGAARYVIGTVLRIFVSGPKSAIIARVAGKRYLDIETGEIFEIPGS